MYSVIETAIKLEVSTRTVQKRCKRDNVRKKDNKYLITDEHIEKWLLEIKSNEPQTNQTNEPFLEVRRINQLDIEIESLKAENESLKAENESLKKASKEHYKEYRERITQANQSSADLYNLKLELKEFQDRWVRSKQNNDVLENNIKEYKSKFIKAENKIEELKEELSQYEVGENERIEVFSNEEYQLFEQRLNEWRTLQKDIEHQQELFKAKQEGSDQTIEHYKQQFEYQRQQSTRILEIHEKLVETVNSQNKIALQRNFIEAKDKGLDKK